MNTRHHGVGVAPQAVPEDGGHQGVAVGHMPARTAIGPLLQNWEGEGLGSSEENVAAALSSGCGRLSGGERGVVQVCGEMTL